ncbi:MAG: polyamine aminopropyltransferase [Methylococcales symbiont of Iophon sp. n. MRB-2018]|nr:MAG: polyamine aminopropyltransferase [Methylococcales symbiont of Iophon sp. n. MRB-2018]KAF3980745.1 MAG: polyamine aminopropyltransferase [Methylococcales symbiont of Iophon sp. n. MRB-2018]
MTKKQLDYLVLTILAIGAGCGLVYEYLLSHYAGRILGAVEVAIYGIISIMMVFMGVGSFLARCIKNPFAGFAWIEVILAFVGCSSVLMISGGFALASLFPQLLAETFSLPPDLIPKGGLVTQIQSLARIFPYIVAALLGTLIGMEIPLIGEIRSQIYADSLKNNAGSIYGIDYLGAGVGAVLWVFLMLSLEVSLAGALTASVNLFIGAVFFLCFKDKIPSATSLLLAHAVVAIWVLQVFTYASDWTASMEDMLYKDKVVYSTNTRYQHLVVTERIVDPAKAKVITFLINGRTQFSSNDEHIYHSMLTYPALAASARHDNILIIGGGDGLAVRDVLRWSPQKVTLLDLDSDLVKLFKTPLEEQGEVINQKLIELNQNAFNDPRVQTIFGDAFITIDQLISEQQLFDTIIIDLPDPNHPDLNKLYSARFYHKIYNVLAGDGALVVQSTSPYHAKDTFISIGKTIKYAGYRHVQQYHHNVPSFGEWGFSIATKQGASARQRLQNLTELPVEDDWITQNLMLAAFEFGKNFFQQADDIKVNRLGSMVAYQYHRSDWQKEMGLYKQ